jgi:hypothetical protein
MKENVNGKVHSLFSYLSAKNKREREKNIKRDDVFMYAKNHTTLRRNFILEFFFVLIIS